MILPIVSIGNKILRKKCKAADIQDPALETFIGNMWDSLQSADGAGLAAPQVGEDKRVFIVDSKTSYEYLDEEERKWFIGDNGIRETFINPVITSRSEEVWSDTEGCLSIPGVWDEVERPLTVTIEYYDRNLEKQVKEFSGKTARVIQHEYDHLEGKLFPDYLSPLKKRIINGRLRKISEGKVKTKYRMTFAVR